MSDATGGAAHSCAGEVLAGTAALSIFGDGFEDIPACTHTGAGDDRDAGQAGGRCACLDGAARLRLADALAERYQTQWTVDELAQRYGLTSRRVRELLVEPGVQIRSRAQGQARRTLAQRLRRQYEAEQTLTVADLAARINLSPNTVWNMLRMAGSTMRHPEHRRPSRNPWRATPEIVLGRLLLPRYIEGESIEELDAPLGPGALAVIRRVLSTYAETPEATTRGLRRAPWASGSVGAR